MRSFWTLRSWQTMAVAAGLWACSSTTHDSSTTAAARRFGAAQPAAAPAARRALTTEEVRQRKKAVLEAEVEARRRAMGRMQTGAPQAAGQGGAQSRYGISDAMSEAELASALAQTPTAMPARELDGLAAFNVLDSVLVDPQTGAVVLLGHTDPAYPTGALPYRAWLADALGNPEPVVSLDPIAGAQTPARLDADLSRIPRDPEFGMDWLRRLVNPVLTRQPGLPPAEIAVLDAKLAKIGIRPEEHQAYTDWMRAGKKNFASKEQYLLARRFMSRLLMVVGAPPSTGNGIMAVLWMVQHPTPENGADAYVQFGNYTEFVEIKRRRLAGEITEERAGALLVAAYGEPALRGLGCPEPTIRRLTDAVRKGGPEDAVLAEFNRRWDEKSREALIKGILHGFRFSGAYLAKNYNLPPVLSSLNLRGGRADSMLLRTLFAADASLKYLSSAAPETTAIGFQQFLVDRHGGQRLRLPRTGMLRYWIEPARVELLQMPAVVGVRFGQVSLRIGAESLREADADAAGVAVFRAALAAYGSKLTAEYDQHARSLPALHALREAAKVIAVARWARQAGYKLSVPAQPSTKPLPSKLQGFWGLTYIVEPTGSSDSIVYWSQGGVTFANNDGPGWLAPAVAPAAEQDTLRQLAASTAFAEHAVQAATDGDLEAARDLAERSAQAMTGRIDASTLPPVPLPEPTAADGPLPGAVQAGVAQVTLQMVDREVGLQREAASQRDAAAQLRETDPAAYAAAEASAQAAVAQSQARLARLRGLLQAYREAPAKGRALQVDLTALAMADRTTAAQPPVAPAQAPAEASTEDTAAPPDLDAACNAQRAEAVALQAELERLTATLQRLQRTVQHDQTALAEWNREASDAAKRANQRAIDFAVGKLTEKGIKVAKQYCATTGTSAAECLRQVEALDKLADTTKLTEWATKNDTSWSHVLEGCKEALSRLPLGEKPKAFIEMTENLIGSAYDITAWYHSWQRIDQLARNSESYLAEVDASSRRMRQIVTRLQDIRAKPGCGVPAPAPVPAQQQAP